MKPEDKNEFNRKLWELETRLTEEINRLRVALGEKPLVPPPPPNKICTNFMGITL